LSNVNTKTRTTPWTVRGEKPTSPRNRSPSLKCLTCSLTAKSPEIFEPLSVEMPAERKSLSEEMPAERNAKEIPVGGGALLLVPQRLVFTTRLRRDVPKSGSFPKLPAAGRTPQKRESSVSPINESRRPPMLARLLLHAADLLPEDRDAGVVLQRVLLPGADLVNELVAVVGGIVRQWASCPGLQVHAGHFKVGGEG
jgi:hypothetical protein